MEQTFGELIRERREAKGLKSYRLAELIGKRPSLISRIENGDYKDTPPPDVVAGLSEALDLPQASILETLGYRVIEEERPAYDAEVDRVARAVAKLSPDQRRLLLGFIDSVTARVDATDPPDDGG